jgi:RecB family exonuclease
VDINVMLPPRRQIALLAHELQHALEIADRPEIQDIEAMESFYEDVGFQSFDDGRHRAFETEAALEMQEAVERDLGGHAPRAHAPAVY